MDARALGREPIPGDNPAGFDAKYEPEYVDVSEEIGKLGSATQGGAISWSKIATQGEIILAQKAKDLQIAAYVGIAWQEARGPEGLRDAVNLFLALFETFWETAFPPLAKLRRRTNAFNWWHERASAALQKFGDAPALPSELVESLTDALNRLDQRAEVLMPDASPLRDLLEEVRRLPVAASESPAQAQDAASEPAPAPTSATAAPRAQPVSKQETPAQTIPAKAPASQTAPPEATTVPAQTDDLQAALKAFVSAASHYALLAHRAAPEDPLPWQVLRLALWSKVTALPPATDGQTHIPPPDAERIAGLQRLLEAGKNLDASLAGEDIFAASIFFLDAQRIIATALEGLGEAYAQAQQRVQEETARFVRRLKGVELLTFDGGRPFADQETLDWLASLGETKAPDTIETQAANTKATATVDTAQNDLLAEAERLAAANQLVHRSLIN
ncbi:MAG: type VI secretion system protein TssA [Desulfovibrio sp.]|nr:type VI secretion system protein TssA [Desulfovibrio sp.]